MQITEITVTVGATQNVGNHSNVRAEIVQRSTVAAWEKPSDVLAALIELAEEHLHDLIDSEMEKAGQSPKYWQGPLYRVAYSDLRQCIVIYPNGMDLPTEVNWRARDAWQVYGSYSGMREMRAAERAADLAARLPEYEIVNIRPGVDPMRVLPALPDAGPEPAWHAKGIGDHLQRLDIPCAWWDELAALEHVTRRYLDHLYWGNLDRQDLDVRLEVIRSAAVWTDPDDAEYVANAAEAEEEPTL